MLSGGVDVKTVQDVLGHENLNTTQIYTHVDSDDLRTAAKANPLSRVKSGDGPKKRPPLPSPPVSQIMRRIHNKIQRGQEAVHAVLMSGVAKRPEYG